MQRNVEEEGKRGEMVRKRRRNRKRVRKTRRFFFYLRESGDINNKNNQAVPGTDEQLRDSGFKGQRV
jgi:hypothetical protein